MSAVIHQPATSPLLASQLQDITSLAFRLNESDQQLDAALSEQEGNGFRAVLQGPIPVVSDAYGVTEYLGWFVHQAGEWRFTQTHPTGGGYLVPAPEA